MEKRITLLLIIYSACTASALYAMEAKSISDPASDASSIELQPVYLADTKNEDTQKDHLTTQEAHKTPEQNIRLRLQALEIKLNERARDIAREEIKTHAQRNSLPARLRRASTSIVDYAKQHPLEVIAAGVLLVAAPTAVYYMMQPSFDNNDPQFKDFYQKLSKQQHDLYKSALLTTKNPLDLVDHYAFIQSLTLDQRIELFALFRNYCAAEKKMIASIEDKEQRREREDDLALANSRCKGFERMLRTELHLHSLDNELMNQYNDYYKNTSTSVQCQSTFVVEHSPTLLCLNAQNHKAAAVLNDQTICVWDSSTGDCIALINTQFKNAVQHLCFDTSGAMLAAVSATGEICIIDSTTQDLQASWTYNNEGAVQALCFNKSSTELITGTNHGIIKVWNINTHEVTRGLYTSNKSIVHLFAAQDTIVILDKNRAYIWEHVTAQTGMVRENDPQITITLLAPNASALLVNDQETWCITKELNRFKLYDIKHGVCKREFEAATASTIICCNRDATLIAYVNEKGLIEIIDTKSGTRTCSFKGLSQQLSTLAFGTSAQELIGIGHDPHASLLRSWTWQPSQHQTTSAGRSEAVYTMEQLPEVREYTAQHYQKRLNRILRDDQQTIRNILLKQPEFIPVLLQSSDQLTPEQKRNLQQLQDEMNE